MVDNKEHVIEYYDRDIKYSGIGTFHCINDLPINKGDKFIVPSAKLLNGCSTSNSQNWFGCSEGRYPHVAYMLPILLTCKGVTKNHIISERYGSYRKDLCYRENQ